MNLEDICISSYSIEEEPSHGIKKIIKFNATSSGQELEFDFYLHEIHSLGSNASLINGNDLVNQLFKENINAHNILLLFASLLVGRSIDLSCKNSEEQEMELSEENDFRRD